MSESPEKLTSKNQSRRTENFYDVQPRQRNGSNIATTLFLLLGLLLSIGGAGFFIFRLVLGGNVADRNVSNRPNINLQKKQIEKPKEKSASEKKTKLSSIENDIKDLEKKITRVFRTIVRNWDTKRKSGRNKNRVDKTEKNENDWGPDKSSGEESSAGKAVVKIERTGSVRLNKFKQLYINGVYKNIGTVPIRNAQVQAILLDRAGNVILEKKGYGHIEYLNPGERASFRVILNNPPKNAARFKVTYTPKKTYSWTTVSQTNIKVKKKVLAMKKVSAGFYKVQVQLRNIDRLTAARGTIMLILYDAQGKLTGTGTANVRKTKNAIKPGQSRSFSLYTFTARPPKSSEILTILRPL